MQLTLKPDERPPVSLVGANQLLGEPDPLAQSLGPRDIGTGDEAIGAPLYQQT
jgi:hypothetical protein